LADAISLALGAAVGAAAVFAGAEAVVAVVVASFFLDFELEAEIEGDCTRTIPVKSAELSRNASVFFIWILKLLSNVLQATIAIAANRVATSSQRSAAWSRTGSI
jgi:hypothetical protein